MKHAAGKKVLTLHGIYSKQIDALHGKTTGNISSSYEKDALTWADAITVVSKEAYDYYTKLGFKVYHVPNAINISSLSQKSERLYDKQIIFAGRLSKEKGILNILEAAKKLPSDIHLIILGTGPEQNAVISYTKTQSNIHYLGYQQKNRTIELIRGSDLLVQPSLVEGISSTILESMACKTPIVATRVGGNEEVLENNTSAILIEPDNPQIMMDKILDLLHDDKKIDKLREQAFKQVQNYDWSHVGNLYLNIYESLLK
jgi:glycosyltransferase involved in cell wall biosynthesis